MIVGLIYPPESDQHQWTILAESTGKRTKEGDKFVVSGEFYYHGYEERKDSYTAVWSKVNDSNFTARYSSLSGLTGDLQLTLKEGATYELTGKYSNGSTRVDTGKLGVDGRIHAEGKSFSEGKPTGYSAKKTYEKKQVKKAP